MKKRLSLSPIFGLALLMATLNGGAAPRIGTLYLESQAALQTQLLRGAEVFEFPQLAALPMLLTMRLPGAALMDTRKPIAMHVMQSGSSAPNLILEISPAGTAEAYLQALVGEGTPLPVPTEGVFRLGDGTQARIVDGRLLLAPDMGNEANGLAGDIAALPALPDMPGAIRLSLAPAALGPMLKNARKMLDSMPDSMPNAAQNRRLMQSMFDGYASVLEQIEVLNLGLDMQNDGLYIRSRLVPKAGTDLAALIASMQPAAAVALDFVESSSMFSYASGSATLPPAFTQRLTDFYTQMMTLAPGLGAVAPDEVAALMAPSMAALGAPMAFTVRPSAEMPLLAQGMMGVAAPAAYIEHQIALMKAPLFQKLSHMTPAAPVKRDWQGTTVYTFQNPMDEAAMAQMMRAAMPSNTPPAQAEAAMKASLEAMKTMSRFFAGGYEYAATPKALAFGMGAPAMVEEALKRVQAPPTTSQEAERIKTKLVADGALPQALGRMSWSSLVSLMMSAFVAPGLAPVAPGEGVIFANWTAGNDLYGALLIPPSEIKAVKAQMQALQMQMMQKAQEALDDAE